MNIYDEAMPENFRWLSVSGKIKSKVDYIALMKEFSRAIRHLKPHNVDSIFFHDMTEGQNTVNISYIYWLMDNEDIATYKDILPKNDAKSVQVERHSSDSLGALFLKSEIGKKQDDIPRLLDCAVDELSTLRFEHIYDVALHDTTEAGIAHPQLRIYYTY